MERTYNAMSACAKSPPAATRRDEVAFGFPDQPRACEWVVREPDSGGMG